MLEVIICTTFTIVVVIAAVVELITHRILNHQPPQPPNRSDVTVICRWAINGCTKEEDEQFITNHEWKCAHRQIVCPAIFRNNKHRCEWEGSVINWPAHLKEKNCVQAVKANCNQKFKSHIGDFTQPGLSVFNMTKSVTWKPVCLVSRDKVQYLVYLTIQRTPAGIWYIIPKSFASPDDLRRLVIKLQLFKQNSTPQSLEYIYIGQVAPSHLSHEEALGRKDYLRLTDAQVSLLRSTDKIFSYKAAIYCGPKLAIQ